MGIRLAAFIEKKNGMKTQGLKGGEKMRSEGQRRKGQCQASTCLKHYTIRTRKERTNNIE